MGSCCCHQSYSIHDIRQIYEDINKIYLTMPNRDNNTYKVLMDVVMFDIPLAYTTGNGDPYYYRRKTDLIDIINYDLSSRSRVILNESQECWFSNIKLRYNISHIDVDNSYVYRCN